MKFERRCQLKVEINPKRTPGSLFAQGTETLTIPPNLTIEFEIERAFISGSQNGTFRILNLGEHTRNLLQRDPFATGVVRAIQFRAGYASFPIALCFNGTVLSATSYRRGVDVVTEITAFDGGAAMALGFTAASIAAGASVRDTIVFLARSLPATTGAPLVGDFPTKSLRSQALFGNTWSVLLQQAGSNGSNLATIDNGQVKVLNLNEAIAAAIPLINSDSGLLGSPRRTPTTIEFDMLFEPRLTLGQILELESSSNRLLNGTYKVAGFNHSGVAPSVGEDPNAPVTPVASGAARTRVLLFIGPSELKVIGGTPVT